MFVDNCTTVESGSQTFYGFLAMAAMFIQFTLVIDMTVLSNRVSAYALICGRMLSEVGLFLLALFMLILTFSSSICALKHKNEDFRHIAVSFLTLLRMAFRAYSTDDFEIIQDEPVVYIVVVCFLIVAVIFLINMLIAQLNCAYKSLYNDMVGFARLRRMDIVVETIPSVSQKRWKRFVVSVAFDERIEFAAGDLGVSGGIATTEPGNLNMVMTDQILRYGGSTSPTLAWPEDESKNDDEEMKFDRLRKLLSKALARITKDNASSRKGVASSGGSASAAEGQEEGDFLEE
jgi:hypothetical protein